MKMCKYGDVVIYTDNGWPLWLRVLIAIVAAGLLVLMGWRYYRQYWKRR